MLDYEATRRSQRIGNNLGGSQAAPQTPALRDPALR